MAIPGHNRTFTAPDPLSTAIVCSYAIQPCSDSNPALEVKDLGSQQHATDRHCSVSYTYAYFIWEERIRASIRFRHKVNEF